MLGVLTQAGRGRRRGNGGSKRVAFNLSKIQEIFHSWQSVESEVLAVCQKNQHRFCVGTHLIYDLRRG